ncbi:death-on-curing protein [Vogesella indigofera]|uniref:Death-on-curing protein n=1 Tax=Vogesella indigofera TaxID=45465 RepID=A0A495BGG0_VOGIN|nr:type II toxin-antitoxin system death-on-curing family toxin [Vogesella indigofera]RKQ59968.1 death-on-curing protein [Vogesella indigofera]
MNISTAIFIHDYLTDYFYNSEDPISPPGVKNKGLLESAVSRPFSSAGGQDAFPDVFDKAAALFHGVISNHSFHNGNKRAALLSTLYFLSDNGWLVDRCDDDEMFEFTRKIAAHEITENREDELYEIKHWLEVNSRRQVKGEQRLNFKELYEILTRFGFSVFEVGNLLEIQKDGFFITRILKKGMYGREEYDQNYVSRLRKQLELTAEYGVDSAVFYGNKGAREELSEFMSIRSDVMRRLARI